MNTSSSGELGFSKNFHAGVKLVMEQFHTVICFSYSTEAFQDIFPQISVHHRSHIDTEAGIPFLNLDNKLDTKTQSIVASHVVMD